MKARLVALVGGLALTSLSGCIIVTDDFETGTFSLEWSIEGDTRGVDCDLVGARRVEIVLFDRHDDWVAELQPRCAAFGVSTELDAGRYSAEVTLVDGFDRAVSYTLVEPVHVTANTESFLGLDFTADDLL